MVVVRKRKVSVAYDYDCDTYDAAYDSDYDFRFTQSFLMITTLIWRRSLKKNISEAYFNLSSYVVHGLVSQSIRSHIHPHTSNIRWIHDTV